MPHNKIVYILWNEYRTNKKSYENRTCLTSPQIVQPKDK